MAYELEARELAESIPVPSVEEAQNYLNSRYVEAGVDLSWWKAIQ